MIFLFFPYHIEKPLCVCVCVCHLHTWFLRVGGRKSGYPESGDNFYPVDLDGVVYDSFNLRTDRKPGVVFGKKPYLGGRCCE